MLRLTTCTAFLSLAWCVSLITLSVCAGTAVAFAALPFSASSRSAPPAAPFPSRLYNMKRPVLDRIASTLFKLENDRVSSSSVTDDKGREGEPMEWSEKGSLPSLLSEVMAGPGYAFKQWVADIIAGDFDDEEVTNKVDAFVSDNLVAMFSFTTCPFCRRAKDFLDDKGVPYVALELDTLDGNEGNEIRAVLGRKTRRTSVPAIFVNGEFVGGCNDGPGLLTLAETGELDVMLKGL